MAAEFGSPRYVDKLISHMCDIQSYVRYLEHAGAKMPGRHRVIAEGQRALKNVMLLTGKEYERSLAGKHEAIADCRDLIAKTGWSVSS